MRRKLLSNSAAAGVHQQSTIYIQDISILRSFSTGIQQLYTSWERSTYVRTYVCRGYSIIATCVSGQNHCCMRLARVASMYAPVRLTLMYIHTYYIAAHPSVRVHQQFSAQPRSCYVCTYVQANSHILTSFTLSILWMLFVFSSEGLTSYSLMHTWLQCTYAACATNMYVCMYIHSLIVLLFICSCRASAVWHTCLSVLNSNN